MRVRLYEVGDRNRHVHRIESFPVTLSTTDQGDLCLESREKGHLRCVLSEDGGNLVVENRDDRDEVFLNDLPIDRGGLMPGDSLRLGKLALMVSYERVTTEPPPLCRFRLAEPQNAIS